MYPRFIDSNDSALDTDILRHMRLRRLGVWKALARRKFFPAERIPNYNTPFWRATRRICSKQGNYKSFSSTRERVFATFAPVRFRSVSSSSIPIGYFLYCLRILYFPGSWMSFLGDTPDMMPATFDSEQCCGLSGLEAKVERRLNS